MTNAHVIVSMKIVNEVADMGKEFAQRLPASNRYRYFVPVIYTSEDGTEFKSMIRGLTKPKLQDRIASMRSHVDHRCLRYEKSHFSDSWSQIISMSLNMR